MREIEARRELGEMSGVGNIYVSIGLLRTGQFERATKEGSPFFRPDAFFILGEKEKAFELAFEQASSGFPETLFYLLNREKRYQELANFLEERWPSLAAFGVENPGDDFGYGTMAEVAFAYSKLGNQERADEALLMVDKRINSLDEQGIDNFVFSGNRAMHFAMLGDIDAAFEHLQVAADGGWAPSENPRDSLFVFENMFDDPRFADVEATMLMTLNRDRAEVGMPALNVDYQVAP